MTTVSATHESRPFNLDVGKTRRVNAKVTTATAYKEGDLLALSASRYFVVVVFVKCLSVLWVQMTTQTPWQRAITQHNLAKRTPT